jgi:hypothetical protein
LAGSSDTILKEHNLRMCSGMRGEDFV